MECPKYEHFDADGWLGYDDAYCLNCLKEDCPNKPKTEKEFMSSQTRDVSRNMSSRIESF